MILHALLDVAARDCTAAGLLLCDAQTAAADADADCAD
jgi:hypothetical protein